MDDGVETDDDARFRSVEDAHANDNAADDTLAGALLDYAALVDALRPGIDGYADFSPAWTDRARALAASLRVSSGASSVAAVSASSALLDLRNRFATLLSRRMRVVRAKGRFVFRKHPAIVREVTSAYERRRRSERKSPARE